VVACYQYLPEEGDISCWNQILVMDAKRMSGMLSEVKKDQKSMLASVFSCVHKNKNKTVYLPPPDTSLSLILQVRHGFVLKSKNRSFARAATRTIGS